MSHFVSFYLDVNPKVWKIFKSLLSMTSKESMTFLQNICLKTSTGIKRFRWELRWNTECITIVGIVTWIHCVYSTYLSTVTDLKWLGAMTSKSLAYDAICNYKIYTIVCVPNSRVNK